MISKLYNDGLTQIEVAVKVGCSPKAVWNSLKRSGVACRKAAKASKIPWQDGVSVGYSACHHRVRRLYGRPKKCEVCGTDDESKKYDWANLTGNYNDPKDYKRMCKSCHLRYDWPKRRKPKIQNNEVERE